MNEHESPKPETELQLDSEGEISPEPVRGRRRRRSAAAEASVNMDELRELIQLIREHEFTEFELEREGFHVRFRRGAEELGSGAGDLSARPAGFGPASGSLIETKAAVSAAPAHPGARAQSEASEDQDLHIIPSPIVGTFYRAASPNAEAFVKIGSRVESESVVCIIEAMKLMNEIQAETSGEVAKIYVENGQPVEYGQPLFGIKK
jgi:acetyl-CoA carboxylase biotin carboxyl carrier protein